MTWKSLLVLMLFLWSNPQTLFAKDGYKITLNFKNAPDSVVYLMHYYGVGLPTIYKADSAMFKNGVATLQTKEKTLGGIYIISLSDKKTFFEFLLDNGDEFQINATFPEITSSLKFTGSKKNDDFMNYQDYLKGFSKEMDALNEEMKTTKTKADTTKMWEKYEKLQGKLDDYRSNYATQNPKEFLSVIFRAMATPKVPKEIPNLPDGTKDETFAWRFYKNHYWDGFDFKDERLIHTPLLDAKLNDFFNQRIYPVPDSVNVEGDRLLAKAKGTEHIFKYILWWLQKNARNSNIMGMDESFVYFIENYYMKGAATWLTDKEVAEYVDRAQKIKPNVIGNLASPLVMKDIKNADFDLSKIKAKYTALVFWSPKCGHCLTEVPKIDSAIKTVSNNVDIKMVGIKTEGTVDEWKDAIAKLKVDHWNYHVHDPSNTSNYRVTYDIIATPVLYLLDENKKIVGKKLGHSNIVGLIENLEKKSKNTKN